MGGFSKADRLSESVPCRFEALFRPTRGSLQERMLAADGRPVYLTGVGATVLYVSEAYARQGFALTVQSNAIKDCVFWYNPRRRSDAARVLQRVWLDKSTTIRIAPRASAACFVNTKR